MKLIENRNYHLDEIKEILGSKTFKEFEKWIAGQTVGMDEEGEYVYYWDLLKFINEKGL